MKNVIVAALCAIACVPVAQAATMIEFTEGSSVLAPGESVFATFNSGDNGGVSGSGYMIQTGSDGNGADPFVGLRGDPYLSVMGNGTATFDFTGGLANLFLDYGSADAYNLFTLTLSDGSIDTFTGQQVIDSGIANGNQTSPLTNGRLTFNPLNGALINSLTVTSSGNSAEIDNLGTGRAVPAVPEPSTWAMMLVGFGLLGGAMRRRKVGAPRCNFNFA